ncbi:scarecrow-like protein 15 [Gastrolobium bilobum]|uniref:scarecrow-like protein 15 n=1 Tax=Gastrolobium bilobum TaxID=150636 RepID=UPI002AB1DE09|nr:scarecrow-like protein 15 [Gastrolobium bilobum]
MRVPISSSPQPNPKLTPNVVIHTPPNIIINNSNNNNHNNPTLCYEPTSVLDLCRSPSPEKKPTVPKPDPEDHLELEDHVLPNLDWWDSIMKDLGLHDDPNTPLLKSTNTDNLNSNPCIPDFPPSQDPPFDHTPDFTTLSEIYSNHNLAYNYNNSTNNNTLDHLVHDFNHHHHINNNNNNNNNNSNWDFIEELIRAADCFDSNNLQLAQAILERLNQRLRSPSGKPLHRAAFHFKDALQSVLSGSNRTTIPSRLSSMAEIVQNIKTFKAFSGISPIPMFSIFTTNQALLEALHGSSFMHVVDFEIGLGIQYASLMKEIAEKAGGNNNSPLLRITAVVPEEYAVESRLIRENLNQFAHDLGIRVQVEFVPLRTFETVSFKAVRFVDGEKIAVLLSPAIFCHLGSGGSGSSTAAFLADVRRISPAVVVFVDGEGWTEAVAAASFRRAVVNSLEFYSMMLESLDASVVSGGGGDWVRRIEMLLLRPKIFAAVEGAGRRVPPWREAFYGAGMRPVQLSQFADYQAECLLAKVQIRGFHVAKRQAELVLFWHERAMVATSAWLC